LGRFSTKKTDFTTTLFRRLIQTFRHRICEEVSIRWQTSSAALRICKIKRQSTSTELS